jgi:hypothetical protein
MEVTSRKTGMETASSHSHFQQNTIEVAVRGATSARPTRLSSTLPGREVAVSLHAETLSNRRVPFPDTSSRSSVMEVAVQVAKSARHHSCQPTSMEVAVWLHAETLINRPVPFTDTSSRVSGTEVAVQGATSARQNSRQPTRLCH